jgi:hypothetical protein
MGEGGYIFKVELTDEDWSFPSRSLEFREGWNVAYLMQQKLVPGIRVERVSIGELAEVFEQSSEK